MATVITRGPDNSIETLIVIAVMEPLLSIQLYRQPAIYRPGDSMRCDYQIDAVEAEAIHAVEASVLWYTEGKGDEDMAVHYFERRVPHDAEESDLRPLHIFQTVLPNSPLSYTGQILQVRWCIRLRLFLKSGKEYCTERPFVLTAEPAPQG
jgi:hypothetical protein